jgi:hypothetical protein
MPDPAPTPPPSPDKTPRLRGSLNQSQLDDLNRAEQLCQVAQRPEFTAALAGRGIDAAFLTALENDIANARSTAGSAVGGTASRASATAAETTAMDNLTAAVREIQTAAKQKYRGGDEAHLQNYFISERIDQRARLEQVASAISGRLAGAQPMDTLPGITPAKVTQLQTLLTAYRDVNVSQTAAQGAATGARTQLSGQIESINQRRRQLQLAAEAEWPSSNPANAAVRREFQLSANRPFSW